MARDEAPPFARGETYYNGGAIDTTDNTTLGGVNLEGKEFVFEEDTQDTSVANPAPTSDVGRPIRVKVVRNMSGQALKGGRVAHFKAESPYGCRVDGYTYAVGDRPAGVIDEYLPAAGVPNGDLFYVVIDGPSKIKAPHTSQSNLAIGDVVVPTAGGGSSATDDLAGRVAAQDLTGTAATLGNNIQHRVGYVDTASNTADAMIPVVVSLASG